MFLCFGFLVVVSLFWFSFFFVAVACFLFMFILFCEKIGKQTRILLLSRHHAKTPFNEAVQNNSNFLLYFCSSKNTSWKKQQSVCLSVVPGAGVPGTYFGNNLKVWKVDNGSCSRNNASQVPATTLTDHCLNPVNPSSSTDKAKCHHSRSILFLFSLSLPEGKKKKR